MSTQEQTPLSQPTSTVRNTLRKKQVSQDSDRPTSDEALREYCDKNYHELLAIIAEKMHQDKVQQDKSKAMKARLNFGDGSKRNSKTHDESYRCPLGEGRKKEKNVACSKDATTEGHHPGLQKDSPKVKIAEGDIGSQSQKGKSQVSRRTICPNHGDVKGAPKCMKISGFMHGVTNPELIKRLHDKIPKSVDEMMRVTTSFLRGEVTASNHEQKKSLLSWKQQEAELQKGGF
ncbi:hypothetical protein Tco_0578768 [Tanacetum coccineum]